MPATTERHEFQAEVKQVLDLLIHSLYANKDIFLRELISNSSDALDKLRFEGLTNPDILPGEELHIRIERDADARTLSISDNGIGMSRDELIQDIGTIAKSGTVDFVKAMQQSKDAETPPPPPSRIDRAVRSRLLLVLHGGRQGHRGHAPRGRRHGPPVGIGR